MTKNCKIEIRGKKLDIEVIERPACDNPYYCEGSSNERVDCYKRTIELTINGEGYTLVSEWLFNREQWSGVDEEDLPWDEADREELDADCGCDEALNAFVQDNAQSIIDALRGEGRIC